MKLILCKKCQDVVRLVQSEERACSCGTCSGRYTNELDAWYKGGVFVVPLGFDNWSLSTAVHEQPENGMGKIFRAFVIPKECKTFIQH